MAHIKRHIIPIILFIFVFGLYIFTASPGTTNYADSSELITASYILGIPHPPGYPIFVLVGKVFSFLPFGEIAFRYSVMSSLLGALAVLFVYKTLLLVLAQGKKEEKSVVFAVIPALVGALSLAFSYIFWLYSIVPEVWAFNSFFTALLLYMGVRWYYSARVGSDPTRQDWRVFWIAVTFSVAFLAQQLIVLLAPAFLYLVWITDRKLFIASGRWVKIGIGVLVGLLPVLYFPLAAWNRFVIINFGNITNLDSLWKLLSRHYYGQNSPTGHAYLQTDLNIEMRLSEISHYIALMMEYFTMPVVFLAGLGLVWILALLAQGKYKDIRIFVGISFLCTGILFAMYTTLGANRVDAGYNLLGVNERMYIMGTILFAFLIGFGVHAFLQLVRKSRVLSVPLFALMLLALPLYVLSSNFSNAEKRDFYLGEDYLYNLFVNVEPNGIFFVRGDMPTFAALYYQNVQKERLDVTLVPLSLTPWQQKGYLEKHPGLWDTESIRTSLIIRDIIADNIDKRPLYFTGLSDDELLDLGLKENPNVLIPRGMITQVSREFIPDLKTDYWGNMRWRHSDVAADYHDWFSKELVEQYLVGRFNTFSWYLRYGYYDTAKQELQEMQRQDPHYDGTAIALGRFGREGGQGYKDINPRLNTEDVVRQAFRFVERGRYGAAMGHFLYLVELEPDNIYYRFHLARTYTTLGWPEEAEKEFLKILELDPNNREAREIVERYQLIK